MNFLLLVYDSCRYDVMVAAETPVLDSYSRIFCAQAPANFTFASHQAFFVGFLPNSVENIPYYNRFCKQLVGLPGIGEPQVVKDALLRVPSSWNLVRGFRDWGYQTVGTGAMNWFRQESLTGEFEHFLFTGTDGDAQIDYLLSEIKRDRPYFGFINFGETHTPYWFKGKTCQCPVDVRARRMIPSLSISQTSIFRWSGTMAGIQAEAEEKESRPGSSGPVMNRRLRG